MNLKLLSFCLSFLSIIWVSPAFANHNKDFWSLRVLISNTGTDHCRITGSPKYTGELSGNIPAVLPATGEVSQFKLNGSKTTPKGTILAKISYRCGSYKRFTLQMKQYYTPENGDRAVEARMINAVDVFEKHRVVHGDTMMGGVGNELSWEISQ